MGGIGITLFFVGSLITVASAFGANQKTWGVICIILLPLTVLYCFKYPQDTQYQRKYLILGTGLILATLLVSLVIKFI
jgi:hypothetical protein